MAAEPAMALRHGLQGASSRGPLAAQAAERIRGRARLADDPAFGDFAEARAAGRNAVVDERIGAPHLLVRLSALGR